MPAELRHATDEQVEVVLRRAAAHLGWAEVEIARASSVISGSCVACIDVVAYAGGFAVLVARVEPY